MPRRDLTIAPWTLSEDLAKLDRAEDEENLKATPVDELKIMAEEMFGLQFQKNVTKKVIIERILAEVDK